MMSADIIQHLYWTIFLSNFFNLNSLGLVQSIYPVSQVIR